MPTNLLRNLPTISEVLESPQLKRVVDRVSHNVVVDRVRCYLDDLRTQVQTATSEVVVPSVQELAERIAQRILQGEPPHVRPVINATGTLLPPDLGSPPLAQDAIEALVMAARDYSRLDHAAGSEEAGDRSLAVESLLEQLTGAETAVVVNSHAGAALLTFAALAVNQEVVVSRGQLSETEKGHRLPEVIAASGALLREVGTTNRTQLADYRTAVGDRTGLLLLSHASNFAVLGRQEEVAINDLVGVGRQRHLPVVHDIGSGGLTDVAPYGLGRHPLVGESIQAGADLVLFRGDKLLGGPRCGIIVGKRALVERICRHTLMQGLRADKLTLAALVATLRLYRNPAMAVREIPLLSLLATSMENLKNRADRLAPQLAACDGIESAEPVEGTACLEQGDVPSHQMPTWCVSASTSTAVSCEQLATALASHYPSVLVRPCPDRLVFDLRTVMPRQDQAIVDAVTASLAK